MISVSAGHELSVDAGLQQHGDAQQRFSLFVHNQCLISHEDGKAFSLNSGDWKDHICTLGVDSIASDSFGQNALAHPSRVRPCTRGRAPAAKAFLSPGAPCLHAHASP